MDHLPLLAPRRPLHVPLVSPRKQPQTQHRARPPQPPDAAQPGWHALLCRISPRLRTTLANAHPHRSGRTVPCPAGTGSSCHATIRSILTNL